MSKELHFLVKQSKKGNQKAQLKLYDLHCKAMFVIACRYLKNTEEAKDAMQDGFLKAFLNLNNYAGGTNFSGWLKTIIINTCIDHLKKKKLETISIEKFPLEISNNDDWHFDTNITKTTFGTSEKKDFTKILEKKPKANSSGTIEIKLKNGILNIN